jgi:hypothetical protein
MPSAHWSKNAAAEIKVPLQGTSSEHVGGAGQIAVIERQTSAYGGASARILHGVHLTDIGGRRACERAIGRWLKRLIWLFAGSVFSQATTIPGVGRRAACGSPGKCSVVRETE